MQFVLYAFALAFGITTAVANPILYTSLNESFRQTFMSRWRRGSTFAASNASSSANRRSTMGKADINKVQDLTAKKNAYIDDPLEMNGRAAVEGNPIGS